MENLEIQLVPDPGNLRRDALIGISDNQLAIDDRVITAVERDGRLFPHVVTRIAANIAVRKCIADSDTQLAVTRSLRDELVQALSTLTRLNDCHE